MPNKNILNLDEELKESVEVLNLDEELSKPSDDTIGLKQVLSVNPVESKSTNIFDLDSEFDLDKELETENQTDFSALDVLKGIKNPIGYAVENYDKALEFLDLSYRPIQAAVAAVIAPVSSEVELSDIPKIIFGEDKRSTTDIFRQVAKEYNLPEKMDFGSPYVLGQGYTPTGSQFFKTGEDFDDNQKAIAESEMTVDIPTAVGFGADIAASVALGSAAIKGIQYSTGVLKGISPTIAQVIGKAEAPLTEAISLVYGGKPASLPDNPLINSLKVDVRRDAANIHKARRALEKILRTLVEDTGSRSVQILNFWEKQVASNKYTFNEIDRVAGTRITQHINKITDAVHKIDFELPQVNKFYKNRVSSLKNVGVDMEEATELLSQFGFGGEFHGNKAEIMKKLGNDDKAFNSLIDIRKAMDEMYNKMASIRFNEITEEVEKLINVPSVSQKYRDIVAQNFEKISKKLNDNVKNVHSLSGNNDELLEQLLEGVPKLDKEGAILRKYIKSTVEGFEEFKYVDNYIRSQLKEEFLYNGIHGKRKKPRAEQLIRSKTETPGLMKEKFDAIPEYQLEKNLEVVLNRYSRTYLDYKYMRGALKGLPQEIEKLKNVPILSKPEVNKFFDTLTVAISESGKNKQFANLYDDIYHNFKKAKSGELTHREKIVLNDFFDKHEGALVELQRVRNYGNVDVDSANELMSNIAQLKSFIVEAPETIQETLPALIRKLRALSGATLKDIPNKNLSYKASKLADKLELKFEGKQLEREISSPDYSDELQRIISGESDSGILASDIKWVGESPRLREGEVLQSATPYDSISLTTLEKEIRPAIDEKLSKEIDEVLRFADRYYSKVDEKVVRQGELVRVLDNGDREGELIDLINEYKQGGVPTITTDAAKYTEDWFVDAIGYSSKDSGILKDRIENTIKKIFPKGSKLRGALVSVLEDLGLKINPRADWDNLADVIRTEVYSNMMGFRFGNVIRNLVQPFLFTLPQLNISVVGKARVLKRVAQHFGNPASWKEFRELALKSDFILSDIDMAKKAIFDEKHASKLFGIKTGKLVGDAWNTKNRVGMFLYNMADLINRFNAYWMAKEAASIAVGSGRKSIIKLLNPAYVKVGDRRALFDVLQSKGTNEFITEYSKLMTNQTQLIYKNIDRSPFLRNKLLRTILMFSKFPVEVASREAHYISEIFRGNMTGLKGVAQDFMYGLFLFEAGKQMGLDLTNMHLMSSLGLPAQNPAIRAAYQAVQGEPVWSEKKGVPAGALKTVYEAYTPVAPVIKTVNELVGNNDKKTRLGVSKYKEGEVPRYLKLSPLGIFRAVTEDTDDSFFK